MNLVKDILSTAFPASIGSFINYAFYFVNMVFIGHLNDPVKLAGMGIGNLILSLVSIGPYLGLNGALETLVSQTRGGGNI